MNGTVENLTGLPQEGHLVAPSRQGLRANIEGRSEDVQRLAQWLASDASGMVPEVAGFDEEEIAGRARALLEEIEKLHVVYEAKVETEIKEKKITRSQVDRLASASAHARQEEGFDDYYAQFNVIIAAFLTGSPPVEIETVGPYACAHIDKKTRKLEFDAARLPKDEKVGLLLAATFKSLAKTVHTNVRIVTLLDEYNDYTNPDKEYQFSDEERGRYVVFVTDLFTELGIIDKDDIPGKDYVVLLESRQRPKFGELVERLRMCGKGEVSVELFSGGKEKIVFKPEQRFISKLNLSRARRKDFKRNGILLSIEGKPTCQALDASGFLDDQNKSLLHLIMLGDHMKGQQDKVFTLLSALSITSSQRFHNVFFKTEELSAEVVVYALLERMGDELRAALLKLDKKENIHTSIEEQLDRLTVSALKELGLHYWSAQFEHPSDIRLGDYSTNVAMVLGHSTGVDPEELASRIASVLKTHNPKWLERIEVVAPGFINFYLSDAYFLSQMETIVNVGKDWGKNDRLAYKKVLLEHSSPNLFKPFHIGHLVNNFVGASLGNIIRFSGAQVEEISYPSDVSPGIAKAVWSILQKGYNDKISIEAIGEAYVYGSKMYEENKEAYQEINSINQQIYSREKGPALEVYEKGIDLSLSYFKEITQRLGSHFSGYIFESESAVVGKEIVEENVPDVFSESRGAIIFKGSEHGLFDDVFVTSSGTVTYLGKDLGLMQIKTDRYVFDQSITITDIEQQQHFRLVRKVAELIDEPLSKKFTFLHHGRLRLTGGKISSRLGNVPLAADLIETLKKEVVQKMESRHSPAAERYTENIALGALKYTILTSATETNMVFDLKTSMDIDNLSGPYLQYAYIRAQAVLRGCERGAVPEIAERKGATPVLERMLIRFPVIVEKSLVDYSPHHVAIYLLEIAQEFNTFYSGARIVDPANPDFTNNVALVKAFAVTLKNGLLLLGIDTIEEM